MSQQPTLCYEFGPFRLDTAQRILLRDGQHISLTPKAYETLFALVENSGRIMDKEYLLNRVWPDTFIEEMTLAKNISTLRKVLAEGNGIREYIETIPKRGYRFAAEVKAVENESATLIREEQTFLQNGGEEENLALRSVRLLPAAGTVQANNGQYHRSIPTEKSGENANGLLHPKRAFVLGGTVVILVIIGIIFGSRQRQNQSNNLSTQTPPQTVKLHPLTNSGNITTAAISPDGKYVAYARLDSGQQSLWLRQTAIASHVQIAPPVQASYSGLTFTPDGNYLYYVKDAALYQMPVLGGTTKKLIAKVAGAVTFSPNGQQLAFVRDDQNQGETAIIKVNTDGSGEQKLAQRQRPSLIFGSAAWTPDGGSITFSATNADASGGQVSLFSVRIADGTETELTSQRWRHIPSLAWLADASGLILTARDRDSAAGSPYQVWHLAYPSGEARRITNDLQGYRSLSLTADAQTLITVQENRLINLWTTTPEDPARAQQIVAKIGPDHEPHNIGWTSDGKIVYTSSANGNEDIWLTESDGSNLKQITMAPHSDDNPAASPDGRYIVFRSQDHRSGASAIWRMDSDGGNLKQLIGGNWPDCSSDGQWVFYTTNQSGISTVWKIAMEGGTPIQLTTKHSVRPAVSPDGKMFACLYKKDLGDGPAVLAIIPAEGGEPIQYFEHILTPVRWTPDGRAVTYIDTREGVSNLWSQPLAGGPLRPLTSFQSETIFSFAWSRDGNRLALVRGLVSKDIVLISNFR
ncbi:MAG: PD40 domain-containing protein [Acidobacteria bacterium]|nr:PD40 domain-containing protein [Acidobacteriota bacterium]